MWWYCILAPGIITVALASETPHLIPSWMPSIVHSSLFFSALFRSVSGFHDHRPYIKPAVNESSPAPVGSTDFITIGFCLLRIFLPRKATDPFTPSCNNSIGSWMLSAEIIRPLHVLMFEFYPFMTFASGTNYTPSSL